MKRIGAGIIAESENIEELKKKIDVLKKQVGKIYIFNNGSDEIQDLKKCKVIEDKENSGTANMLNRLCQTASEDAQEWILLVGEKIKIPENIVEKLSPAINDDVAAIIPEIIQNQSEKIENQQTKGLKEISRILPELSLTNLDAWEKMNGFDEDYYQSGIYRDFGYRANSEGYRILKNQDVCLFEDETGEFKKSVSVRKIYKDKESVEEEYAGIWDAILLDKKLGTAESLLAVFKSIFRILFYEDSKKERLHFVFSAIKDADGEEIEDLAGYASLTKKNLVQFLKKHWRMMFYFAGFISLAGNLLLRDLSCLLSTGLYCCLGLCLTVGFLDKPASTQNRNREKWTFRILTAFEGLLLIIVSILVKDSAFIAFSVSFYAVNMNIYLQRSKNENQSRILYWLPVIACVLVIMLSFIGIQNTMPYLAIWIVMNYVQYGIRDFKIIEEIKNGNKPTFSFLCLKEKIKNGLWPTLKEHKESILFGMGMIFAKVLLNRAQFACYGYAFVMMLFFAQTIRHINKNLFSPKKKDFLRPDKGMMIISSFSLLLLYPVRFCIENFNTKYRLSVITVAILFVSVLLFEMGRTILKEKKDSESNEHFSLYILLIALVLELALNIIFSFLSYGISTFACTLFICSTIFFFGCSTAITKRFDFKAVFYLLFEYGMAIVSMEYLYSYFGLPIYLIYSTFITYMFYREEVLNLLKYIHKDEEIKEVDSSSFNSQN